MMKELKVYGLSCRADESIVVRTSLEFFHGNFDGKRLGDNFCRPVLSVFNTSKRCKDFVSFMLTAPLLSEKAVDALMPLLKDSCEFIHMITVKHVSYFALNCLVVRNCIHEDQSEIIFSSSEPDRIIGISSYVFKEEEIPDVPAFKVFEHGQVMVRRPFIDVVLRKNLTNAVFEDPQQSAMGLIARGEDIQVIPESPR